MKAYPKSVHAVEVFHCGAVMLESMATVDAMMTKDLSDGLQIRRVRNAQPSSRACTAADFVKEHADQLVGDIGLRSPGRPTQSLGRVKLHRKISFL